MIIFACVDEKNGMMFNRRRQSSDREVIQDILSTCGEKKIRMNSYSEKLFEAEKERILVSEHFLEETGQGEYCFVENQRTASYEDGIEEVILYRWNRRYPGDFFFDLDLGGWEMVSSADFEGYSHEKITKETYLKEKTK